MLDNRNISGYTPVNHIAFMLGVPKAEKTLVVLTLIT